MRCDKGRIHVAEVWVLTRKVKVGGQFSGPRIFPRTPVLLASQRLGKEWPEVAAGGFRAGSEQVRFTTEG